ncbi:unnamed protein product, partial [Sphacelaria rigidula]
PPWASPDREEAFALLAEHLPLVVQTSELEDAGRWKRWATSPECERDFPTIRSLTQFQRVLLVQALRPDRLQSAVHQFAVEVLRVSSLSPPAQSLEHLFLQESSVHHCPSLASEVGVDIYRPAVISLSNAWKPNSQPSTCAHLFSTAEIPVLLVTTSGADPGKEMEELAERTVGRSRYQEVAMGGGQQEVAVALLRAAALAGDWVCLKNLHLVVAWLPSLEKELSALQPHTDFRLWLTTEPHDDFPPLLLQQSLKV